MKTKVISTTLMALVMCALSAMTVTAQGKKGMAPGHMDHAMMEMANEPHHVLAMAYHQNLAVFAKALHERTLKVGAVNVEFARSATTEMRRSFDQMNQHHQDHMHAMSAEMHTKMADMMKQMETQHSELSTQLAALEQAVEATTPDAQKVVALAASVNSHLDAMAKMHPAGNGGKMKMKM